MTLKMNVRKPERVLVAGWFSFEKAGATAGDLLARRLVCEWIETAGYPYDVALALPFTGGVDWQSVDPQSYSHVVFVCGPFFKSNLLQRFRECHLIGVNLSMMESVESWNPFDFLLERDSSSVARPDITFLAEQSRVPIVGITLGGYGNPELDRSTYAIANATIHQFAASREMSTVIIDTRLDVVNTAGLRSPGEIQSLIARMDVVITTRLHGMVLAIKNGVPAIALDPIPGGGKIRRQAEAIGWPLVFQGDSVKNEELVQAFEYCLTEDARTKAVECYRRALHGVETERAQFISTISRASEGSDGWGDGRRRGTWINSSPSTPESNADRNKATTLFAVAPRLFSLVRRAWVRREL